MARVGDIPIDEVPEGVKPVFARYSTDYGPFANQVNIFAQRPLALKHIYETCWIIFPFETLTFTPN